MKHNKTDILKRIDRKGGFKVPENYFEDFVTKMEAEFPEHEVIPKVKPSTWNRIRPYVYMTAMFAGIWCMMWVFNDIVGVSNKHTYNPTIIAGFQNEENLDEIVMHSEISEYDIFTYQDSIDAGL